MMDEERPREADALQAQSEQLRLAALESLDEDFELPAKACDIGRPEGCESCQ